MKKLEQIQKQIKQLQVEFNKQQKLELKEKLKQFKPGVIITGDFGGEDELSYDGRYRQISKYKIKGESFYWSQPDKPNSLDHSWDLNRIQIITDKKLIAKLKKPIYRQELKLNDEYTAVITKKGVKVGCQDFDHKTIKALYLVSVKAQNS